MSSNRIEQLNSIVDYHIQCLGQKDEPILSDTKTLTEILKSILLLEQIKSFEGKQSKFDEMSEEELEKQIRNLGGDE